MKISYQWKYKVISLRYLCCCLVSVVLSSTVFGMENGTGDQVGLKAEMHAMVASLVAGGIRHGVTVEAMPEWVWRHLGETLETAQTCFCGLLASLDEDKQSYQREVIFQSEDYSDLNNETVPFAIVAIILPPGEATVTHDHVVECGPLLVYGEVTERYGYSDQLVNKGTNIAILNKKRHLKKYRPQQYFFPVQDNTHRLKEASGNQPAITLNLYVDARGQSIKNRFPNFIGIDSQSGEEWWSE